MSKQPRQLAPMMTTPLAEILMPPTAEIRRLSLPPLRIGAALIIKKKGRGDVFISFGTGSITFSKGATKKPIIITIATKGRE